MNAQELIDALREHCFTGDYESDHIAADDLLIDFATKQAGSLGEELNDVYEAVGKWYA